jgi:hypothetical protein
MFDCQKVSMMVSESMDRNLPLHQRLFIAIHLLMCKHCHRFKKQLQILRHAAGFDDIHEDVVDRFPSLSTETREQIKQAMRDFSPDSLNT